ncbi:hypothetical protein H8E88_20895 [candidate division KSB1 bacterium]|nr:hypothetical protein [candidate division KSB1 bacterium]MBL7094841.1 hypothetical protein [candidate division KSB1 bacterium]
MKNIKSWKQIFLLMAFLSTFLFSNVFAQEIQDLLRIPDSTHVQVITTIDKSKNIGRIVKIGEVDIVFKAEFGTIIIPIAKIKEIKEIPASSIKDGVYWFPNPNATRLYFSPTARMLKQGEGYFADYYLFFPAFAYGITNNITIGGGMSLIPNASLDEQMFYFTPKIGLKATKTFNIAAGALVVKIPNWDDENGDAPLVGILYGVGTAGTPDASFTFGLGYGFVDGEFAKKPMVVIGGERRISRRTAFVTENWVMPGVGDPIISYGLRFFGEKMSVDLALINTLSDDIIFPGVPYIDFVINF